VISILQTLADELQKEVTVGESEDEYSQKTYQRMLDDTAARRAASATTLVQKESVKADTETAILEATRSHTAQQKEKVDAEKFASSTKADCDWLMSNYEARKTAREAEDKSLRDTKAVLNGADYSFIQKEQKALRGAVAVSL